MVSVVIPCYNQGEFLEECVNSLFNQTFPNWECLIVDDGSSDNSRAIANNLIEQDNRIKYHYKTNGGLSSARNYGISHAVGEFILPLDADDFISTDYLELALIEIQKSINTKVVFGAVQNFGTFNERYVNDSVFNFKKQLISNQIHCSGMFRKSDALKAGGYDEKMKKGFEDWEFYIRLLGNGGDAVQLKDIALNYRRKEASMLSTLSEDHLKLEVSNYILSKNIKYYNQNRIDAMEAINFYFQMKNPENVFSYKKILSLLLKKVGITLLRLINMKKL
ncbi:MAG: glycosyltransferase family 2 protein [Bacteroidota bacterium]